MTRRLTQQEQLLIVLGGLVVLLLIVYGLITGITRQDYTGAKASLDQARRGYKEAVELRGEYKRLGHLIDTRKLEIAQQDPNFDLTAFIDRIENRLVPPFTHSRVTSAIQESFAGGKYTGTRITYTYQSKSIGDIVRFLYEIENPESSIIITNIKLLADEGTGTHFTMTVTFSIVTTTPSAGP
jgi:hypothetical protein